MLLLVTFALMGCAEKKAHQASFQVEFACPDVRELADTLTLRILRDGCSGKEVVAEQALEKGQAARAVNGLSEGTYGLEARASSAGDELARGCLEVSLPLRGEAQTPTLVLGAEGCVDSSTLDDGGSELLDASLEHDAGAVGPSMEAATCAVDCSDSFPCTEDRCVDGECVHEPFTGARECDGIACTVGDSCEMGTCRAGAPDHAACPDDGEPCTAETCDPLAGCNRENAEDAVCDDRVGCTAQDACRGGICRGVDACDAGGICSAATGVCTACTGAADCDDRDPCTTDSCSAGSCRHANNTASCSDGKSCTSNDVCNNRVCAGISTCPSDATCGGSACRCNDTGKALCSNTCVVLSSSSQHCGQCGRACTNGGTCQNSACRPSAAGNCTAYRYGGHDYLLCNDRLSWASARDRCRGYGFGLAIISSQGENDFLRSRPSPVDRWTGANDRGDNGENCRRDAEEGAWYWADPNSTGNDNFRLFCAFADRDANTCAAANSAYQNWRNGEPNNDGCDSCVVGDCSEGEDCGMLNADGTWNDGECANQLAFICEMP
ncbi:MAG TPA: lectin-like protein [Polyangiales bacterium]